MGQKFDRGLALSAREDREACEEILIRQSGRGDEDVCLHASSCITAFFMAWAGPWEDPGAPPGGPFGGARRLRLRRGLERRGRFHTAIVERVARRDRSCTSEIGSERIDNMTKTWCECDSVSHGYSRVSTRPDARCCDWPRQLDQRP